MTKSKIFLFFCLSFLGGVFVYSFFKLSIIPLIWLLIFSLISISVFWRYKKIVVLGFCFLFFISGIFTCHLEEKRFLSSEILKYNDTQKDIVLLGFVAEPPQLKEKVSRLTIQGIHLYIDGKKILTSDRVLVTTDRYPEYSYGDILEIKGKVETPQVFEDFNYKDYLKKERIYSILDWPKIEKKGDGAGNPMIKAAVSFKEKIKSVGRVFFSPPQLGFLEALLFGDEENISSEWKEKLNTTGTRHIAAVSGMNITIISFLIFSFFISLGLWRKQAFYLSLFLIAGYILMIGFPASAVRAGIMAALALIAQNFGRSYSSQRAIFFAATFMVLENPLLLRYDIGFQLSFLAILGIVNLNPLFSILFFKLPSFFKETLSSTLSAQIFTLPVLIYNFGYISLVSPLANILIVPLLAPLTILLFVFVFSGMVFLPLAFVFSLPAWFFLTYITKTIDIFSKIPFASFNFKNVHWAIFFIFYSILVIIVWKLKKRFAHPIFLRE